MWDWWFPRRMMIKLIKRSSSCYGTRLEGFMGTYSNFSKLHTRNTLPSDDNQACTFCEFDPKSVSHVLFLCLFAYNFWMECIKWMRLKSPLPSNPTNSLLLFNRLLDGKKGRILGVCIWECVMEDKKFNYLSKGKTKSWWAAQKIKIPGLELDVSKKVNKRVCSYIAWRNNPCCVLDDD